MSIRTPLYPLAIAAAVVIIDQLSKLWIMTAFRPFEIKPVIPGLFNLIFITNTGAAFGMLAGEQTLWRQLFFGTVAVIALVVLVYAFRQYRDRGILYVTGIGLVAGGAVGNLIDRVRFGHVVDFLDFFIGRYHWPAFNAADSAITIGVGLFLLATLGDDQEETSK
ncbi:MAG: signal peptidase II [Proteobacteria bacterium]|nr:signal peptidase II [Pseudomonadota bacterium]MBU1737348.1 signal peptidase II [Pseudomonadota bacterium]